MRLRVLLATMAVFGFLFPVPSSPPVARAGDQVAADPLVDWNDGPAKREIIAFVSKVTQSGGHDFVRPADRIATFDNDGTLWVEHPNYAQVYFILRRLKALTPHHARGKKLEPIASALEGDAKRAVAGGHKALDSLLLSTHVGLTTEEFDRDVLDWMHTARHPRFDQPFNKCVYQPMLQLMVYLRANRFKTYIVSGGGVDFMRPWTEEIYGVPPEQVIGSSMKVKYEIRDGQPVLIRLPQVDFVDDGPGKPIGIHKFIDKRPIAAFGNSDGDLQMLQWTTAGSGPRFGLLVHHTDAIREYAYDRHSHVGRLDKALDEAPQHGWTVVDMKRDWKRIFAFEK